MYLELAENNPAYLGANMPPAELLEYMVQIPTEDGGFVWVREDQLDGIDEQTLYEILQQQPHLSGIKDLFARMKARRTERKTARVDKRDVRKETKATDKANRVAGRRAFFGGIVDKVTGAITGGQQPAATRGVEDIFPQITGGANIGVAKWWQNPMVMGLGALVLIGGIWMVAKKKK